MFRFGVGAVGVEDETGDVISSPPIQSLPVSAEQFNYDR